MAKNDTKMPSSNEQRKMTIDKVILVLLDLDGIINKDIKALKALPKATHDWLLCDWIQFWGIWQKYMEPNSAHGGRD